jgi:protein-tyrosine phosphatase
VIDLHTQILPGLDDGARTLEDALEMARAFVADGVTTVAATPHVRGDYPTSAEAAWLTDAVPSSVVERRSLPPRP